MSIHGYQSVVSPCSMPHGKLCILHAWSMARSLNPASLRSKHALEYWQATWFSITPTELNMTQEIELDWEVLGGSVGVTENHVVREYSWMLCANTLGHVCHIPQKRRLREGRYDRNRTRYVACTCIVANF